MSIFTKRTSFINYLFLLVASTVLLQSCEPKNDENLVPSYIRIDKITVNTDSEQGSSSSNITDAWVYINDELIGSFELPATVPMLVSGEQNITIRPGIKLNGVSNTRAVYPFYGEITRELNLVKDSVINLQNNIVTYKPNVNFALLEDFEVSGTVFDTTSKSTVDLLRTDDPSKVFPEPDNSFSGIVQLTGDTAIFELVSRQKYSFPAQGGYVFLELNFKTNTELAVGVFYDSDNIRLQRHIITLNKTDEWKKIYINLTPVKYTIPDASDIQIFLGAAKMGGTEVPEILLDNIKLLYFKNSK